MSVGFCCWFRQPHERSAMQLGDLVRSPKVCPLARLTPQIFRCYLRVSVTILEKTVSQYIPYFNVLGNSGGVFLFENPGGFVCWNLYRVQLNNAKNILLRKEFYFRKWLLNWNKRKITSKRSQFIDLSTFPITCLVVMFLFRVEASAGSQGLPKGVILSLSRQVCNFRQDESRIWCFLY